MVSVEGPLEFDVRPQKDLVRRAQWDQHGCRSRRGGKEQAWKDHLYQLLVVTTQTACHVGRKSGEYPMSPLAFKEILQLSVAERVQLVEDIWDSIVASPESLPVTDAQKQELDRRRDAHATSTAPTRFWDEIRAKLGEKG